MRYLVFLIIALSICSAYPIEKSPCIDNEACCEKIKPGPFAFSHPKDNSLVCPKNFSVFANFLWMAFYEEGLEYAASLGSISSKSRLEFNPGFRVGLMYEKDLFNLNAVWTYIRFKDDNLSNASTSLLGLFLPPESGTLTGASSRISGDFNTLDLNISKPYHVSRYFISNPKIGIQVAFIDQDYHLRYFVINQKFNSYLKNDFWGVGLETGYDAEFVLGKNFTFYADVLAAILFSKFDISEIVKNISIYHYELSENFYKVVPNAKIGIGFTWSKLFDKKRAKAKLSVGYEFQNWWSINQLRRPMDTDPSSFKSVARRDLTFNGLKVGVKVDI